MENQNNILDLLDIFNNKTDEERLQIELTEKDELICALYARMERARIKGHIEGIENMREKVNQINL